jgi:hypothetical protein
LLGEKGRGSRKNHHQGRLQNGVKLGNRSELSNHSFSSRCRAYWRTAALELTRQRQALVKERVRCAPAEIAIAAGRHHITNFDAELACDAALPLFDTHSENFSPPGTQK